MNRILVIFALFFPFFNGIRAQKVIQMEKDGGVYKIPCVVNGAKMKMVFDTGASVVTLSETMADFLYENDYISEEDILGKSQLITADGSTVNSTVINIKDIEISGLHLKNVRTSVIKGQSAPLLLGQTAIQQLGRISLNGDKLIINDYEGDYSDKELNEMAKMAIKYYKNGSYYASIDNWLKVIDYVDLSTYGYYMLVSSLLKTKQWDECIKYGKEWEKKFRNEEPSNYTSIIMTAIATSLDSKGNTREAITYFEKLIPIDIKLGISPGFDYAQIALSYMGLEDFDSSISFSKKALKSFFEEYNLSEKEIERNGTNNQTIGSCLYYYALALYCKNDVSSGNYIMELSAKCNYDKAIDYCYSHNIRYNQRRTLFE